MAYIYIRYPNKKPPVESMLVSTLWGAAVLLPYKKSADSKIVSKSYELVAWRRLTCPLK